MKTAKRERVPGVSVKNTKPALTKAEMIKAIQVAEATAWKELGVMKDMFGEDSEQAALYRRAWSAVFELREALGLAGLTVAELIERDLLPQRNKLA